MKRFIVTVFVVATLASSIAHSQITSGVFGMLKARAMGPATSSGRVTAIEAVYVNAAPGRSDKRLTIYVGSAAGGVWKSKDNGTTFKAMFDKEKCQSIGAMALDPRHEDSVLWVGTGESNVRNSVSIGGGLYKTTDAGETWKMMGLENVERISKIAVNPKNPDIVLVAAPGALWGNSEDRGLYRTTNGGKTFTKVLYVDDQTGCADVAIDPSDPNIVYASMWQFRRKAFAFSSGGSGSGFYKSTDGGATWNKLSKDIPSGDLGRVIISIAPSNPKVVYAMIESKESGLYRSSDRGESWTKMSNAVSVTARPFYFSCLYVDPFDENRVYRPSFQLGISNDGGRTFNGFSYGGGNHPDHHALWIDPTNPQHLLLGTDGGVYRTYDRGATWVQFRNLPLAQFYRISYDLEDPYNIFGGLQDNGSWMVVSRNPGGSIQNRNWESTGWGDGFAVIRDRFNKDIIYFESQGGEAVRRHISSSEAKPIKPFEEAGERKLRFNWNTPLTQSPTNPRTIYIGSQFLHRSRNQGDSWERISPDLTTNDSVKYNPEKSGGVTADNTSAENHCTIYSIAESPLDENIIWVGTDDGNLQVTLNGGTSWTNVAGNLPQLLPAHTWISTVEPGHFDKGTAFVTCDNHTRGDMNTYVYMTTDYGKTWKSLMTDSLRGYAHVVREDLVNKNLLFLGTEYGLWISIDRGANWVQYKGNIPSSPVRDIAVQPRENDLIVATHGRGAYILDDISPLRALTPEALSQELVILPARPTPIRFQTGFQEFAGADEYQAGNPNGDAAITYYLKSRHMIGTMTVEILDSKGEVLATVPAGKRKGVNRIYWGMSIKPPKTAVSPNTGGGNFGPTVLPGNYSARITKNGKVYTCPIKIVEDPQSIHKLPEREAQFGSMMKLYNMQERLAYIVELVTSIRDTLKARVGAAKTGSGHEAEINVVITKLDSLHKKLVAAKSSLFAGTENQLRERIADLYESISQYAGKPSDEQMKRLKNLEDEIERADQAVQSIVRNDVVTVNKWLQSMNMAVVTPLTQDEFKKMEN